jgi:multiple sugar transport system substrate-binding protein
VFNNQALFNDPKDDYLAALAEADAGLRPDFVIFPGVIDQFREKAIATYAGGDLPDAQWIHPSITALLAANRLLRPLEEFTRRDRETPLAEFYPGLVEYFRWQEKAYGLPWNAPGYTIAFNRALFERLGVPPPDRLSRERKWTWEAFVTTLRDVTRGAPGTPERTIGWQPENANLDWACAWIWRNGGELFSKDLKRCLLNEPAAVEAVQGMADLHLRYQVVNLGPQQADFPGGFASGRVAMQQLNKGSSAALTAQAQFDKGIVSVPQGKAGKTTRSGPLAFGLVQGAPNGDAGWRWVRFMAGPQAAAVQLRRKITLPVRARFAQLPEFAQSMEAWEDRDPWLESQATARAIVQPASYQEVATLWLETWQRILAQAGPVKPLLDDLVRQADAVLAR